jgi:MurNAc alpha-1-phosphate uridylyltransferase
MRAMILAAGRGERMRPLTDHTPKPLLHAAGKPLIVWHIERLVAAGITEIVINLAWLGSQIERALSDGRQYGARISYSHEQAPLETAGGIVLALDFFQKQPFLVINADIWCDWNPQQASTVRNALQREDKSAWLLLTDNPPQHPQGDFHLDPSGCVMDRIASNDAATLTFCGIGVYRPSLFQALPKNQPAALAPLLRSAMSERQVIGTRHHGCWTDVGTPQRLAELNARLAGLG